MQNILIIGANSAIAKACARHYAAAACHLYLLGRDKRKLEIQEGDLSVRGAKKVDLAVLDSDSLDEQQSALEQAKKTLGVIDLVLICHGVLPDQQRCENDFSYALQQFHTNTTSTLSLLNLLAPMMSEQGKGTIAVITSVAGDRGRQSNYYYGASKGAVSIFIQGLRGKLFSKGISVIDIKPGFVDTPMTNEIEKGGPLWSTPERVAQSITKGIDKGKPCIYAPGYWRYILLVVRLVPEFIFKRLKL
ncbi:MAG: SDR family oxidoreductase [Pseudohongiellaceae bacterium]|nr:SDR family oxidoreductase [Pseudohongiellaceae bacterium]